MSIKDKIQEHLYDTMWSLGPAQITFPVALPIFVTLELMSSASLKNLKRSESKNRHQIRSAAVESFQDEVNKNLCNIIFVTFALMPIVGPIGGKRVSKRVVGMYTTLGRSL